MDPGALDAQQHPQVDGGPAGGRLAAVRAQVVAGQTLDPLEEALPSPAHTPVPRPLPPPALPGLAGRVDAAGGGRGGAVQTLSRGGEGRRGGGQTNWIYWCSTSTFTTGSRHNR